MTVKCTIIHQQLLAYLDGEVTIREKEAIEEHLAACEECRAELERLRELQAGLRSTIQAALGPVKLPRPAEARISARLRRAQRARAGDLWGIILQTLEGLWGQRLVLAQVAVSVVVLLALVGTVTVLQAPPRIPVAQSPLPTPTPAPRQEILVLGQDTLAPGVSTALRVFVRDVTRASPVAGASIVVSLLPLSGANQAIQVFQGKTGPDGTVEATFTVPEDLSGEHQLQVTATSPLGTLTVAHKVTVRRTYKIMLTCDKPIYQPGQVIHMRALVLNPLDMHPVPGQAVDFLVVDPKGNKVFRRQATTSEFGIASADFTLATEVNIGSYHLSASLGDTTSEKTVTVKPYVLPKFKVTVETDRTFYQPGERVSGYVQARYFFGKPVSQGEVELLGYTYDVEKEQVLSIQGRTDEEGYFEFEFDLPEYFVGGAPEAGQSEFGLEVRVTDQARHTEQTSKILPVAAEPIVIEVAPESGVLKHGLENIIYLITSYPDGSPAPTEVQVTVDGHQLSLQTDQYGLAEFTYTPQKWASDLTITARDTAGHQATKTFHLTAEWNIGQVLLRPDRASYRVGETMYLEVFASSGTGTVYLDIVKEGLTLYTGSATLEDGHAVFAIDTTPEMFGSLELRAYKVLANGSIIRDTRLVFVDWPHDLNVSITTDKEIYRPAETAQVTFEITDTTGSGVQSALGVAVVDESVFALEEQEPGFARLYFMLEKELLEPKYQIKGFTLPGMILPAEESYLRETQDRAARAAWADAPSCEFTLQMRRSTSPPPLPPPQPRVRTRVNPIFSLYHRTLTILLAVLSSLVALTAVVGGRYSEVAPQARRRLLRTLIVLLPWLLCGLVALLIGEIRVSPDKAFLLGTLLAMALTALGFHAHGEHDRRVVFIIVLIIAYVVLIGLVALVSALGLKPSLIIMLIQAATALLMALGLYYLGLTLQLERKPLGGWSLIALSVLLPLLALAAIYCPYDWLFPLLTGQR